MEECITTSPLQCPNTVTIRRNPHRSARPTPSNTASKTPKNLNNIPNFPINDVLSIDLQNQTQQQQNPNTAPSKKPSNSLNVFLRIRPLPTIAPSKNPKLKQVTVNKGSKSCVVVNGCNSVTVSPPNCDSNRLKSEVYDGFSHVFASDSSQDEVYEKLMRPMVEEFLNGRSGLLAALGPSGSGKTHTVFGSAKDPGLVPRVLRHIFDPDKGKPSTMSRLFYLSIFEIYSEKGKGEKLSDLSPEGSDIHMQQSVVKGLKEIVVKDVAHAESIIAYAKSKRATAMTNSNSLSSRSQCIINIRCAAVEAEGESDIRRSEAVLTFVDLAGAEREKKTGNKGGRLLESNFINNTSMVFGLCLRSLLEHQKHPKKPLQKHFQSSLLTRYLRDYLEGRKRMALILTVRAGEEDYFDTSSLLRQASPYMEIKFCDVEETFNLPNIKKRRHIIGNEQQKRAKLNGADARDDVEMACKDSVNFPKEIPGGNKRNNESQVGENSLPEVKCTESDLQRQYNIMQGFAKALWSVLKQYKERVKTMQNDIDVLTDNLKVGHAQYLVMEKELLNLKSQCSCPKQVVVVASCSMGGPNSESRYSEVPADLRVIPAEVQVIADIECKEKESLDTVGEECTSHHECERVGMTAPKDLLECSTSECKSTTLLWEKNIHFEGEFDDTLKPEAGSPCIVSDGRFAGISASEENRSESIKDGSLKLLELESANVSKVHCEDYPSGPKSLISADEEIDPDVTLSQVSHGATPSSIKSKVSSPQSSQLPVMECQVSHDKSKNDFHVKDQRKECSEESTVAAALPRSPVIDSIVQDVSCGCNNTPYEKDKENVANFPRSSISSEQETKEVSHSKALKSERPKSINSELETKEVSKSKPSKPKRPRRINSELETKEVSHSKLSKTERPKRRLMPASSLLLRDAGNIDVADENVKHRGGRGGQKLDEDEHKRTQGNAHLLQLLKNHLPR